MVIDARAQQGLCVCLPRNQVVGPWDGYVRLKNRLCNDGGYQEFLSAFYDPAALGTLFQPEPGCSDPTFSGSTADAMGIAASALNLAAGHGVITDTAIGIAFAVPSAPKSHLYIGKLDEMEEHLAGKYRVRIAKKVAREARAWVRQNNRLRTTDHETGGLLWGMWDEATGIIWLFDASGPPKDSLHDPGHFLCGVRPIFMA